MFDEHENWLWIKGGARIGESAPAQSPVIFLGHFPESVYGKDNGHYQSLRVVRPNNILVSILEGGGFDVASYLQLTGEF